MNIWHFIKKDWIEDYKKYETNEEDERRLMYVAITRSKKYLYISFAPKSKNRKKPSIFLEELQYIPEFKGKLIRKKTKATQKKEKGIMTLNFSLLNDFFKCNYAFKFYKIYGFKEPLSARIGYGKSIHDALMEINKRAMEHNIPKEEELEEIFKRHKNFPYAIKQTEEEMEQKANKVIKHYYETNKSFFNDIEYVEKSIEFDLGNIIVNGRIDLIVKKDEYGNKKIHIVDFKSKIDTSKPNDIEVIKKQLYIYASGYEELTGKKPDIIEIYNFDNPEIPEKEIITPERLNKIKKEIQEANEKIQNNKIHTPCNDDKCVCKFIKD